jgi:conjugative transposon TraM protein
MDKKQQNQLKKGLVFGGLVLLFALSMWFIFAPSGHDKTAAQEGLNDSIPQATVEELPGNKLKAYEQGNKSLEEQQAQADMEDLSEVFARQHADEEAQRVERANSRDKIEVSMQRYAENNRLLNSFYTPDPNDREREELRSQVEALKTELSKKNANEEDEEEDRQLALMEKSYQMAAKYLPKSTPNNPTALNNAFAQAQERTIVPPASTEEHQEQTKVLEVFPERKQVVSYLSQPMSDEDFIKTYGTKARNLGFHSVHNNKVGLERNTLQVQIDRTVVLKEGDDVVLRLLEDARIQDLRLPRQSRIVAQAKVEGNRMHLIVKSIEQLGRILPIKLSAYDMDGQEGVYIPELENMSALKEMGANIGGTMGTSFTFASSAKDQLISEATRGVMQGVSQLLQKKLRTIKVTIKGGYKLYLMPSK